MKSSAERHTGYLGDVTVVGLETIRDHVGLDEVGSEEDKGIGRARYVVGIAFLALGATC